MQSPIGKSMDLNPKQLIQFYYKMLRIRLVEQKISEIYPQQEMRCPIHLCIGQEAVAVGVCEALSKMDLSQYKDTRIVIKGCSGKPVPTNAFVKLTAALKPLVKSIMYGEPCSTVPIFKKK